MKKNTLPALVLVSFVLLVGCQQQSADDQNGNTANVSDTIVSTQQPLSPPHTSDTTFLTQQQTEQQQSPLVQPMAQLPDYGLFRPANKNDDPSYTPSQVKYYDDGTVTSGKYAGYHRIVAFGTAQQQGPDSNQSGGFLFMTQNYKTFISDSENYSPGNNDQPNNTIFNLSKVTGGDTIPLNHPSTILSGGITFTLNNSLPTLPPNVNELTPAIYPGLRFFSSQPENSLVPSDTSPYQPGQMNNLKLEQQYVAYDTYVYAVDQYGLVYQYDMNSPDLSALKKINDASLYASYGNLFPLVPGCGNGYTYILKGITDQDLQPVASENGLVFYTLVNPNHPLNQAEYYDKIQQFVDNPPDAGTQTYMHFQDVNPDPENIKQPPTFAQYVAKNPVLIYKDIWGRYVGMGEAYYFSGDGCGKPVIYLYPQTPTTVTVKLATPATFTTDIPTYDGQWKVLANSDSQLKDLQPSATDCASIDTSKFGSEYAADACKNKIYPYLYWSGNTANAHPRQDTGWVVGRADLQNFLQEKMADMGYNSKETADMTSYWVPEMLGKNAPYYRVSFLQTAQMNTFIPLEVTPKPQTMLRMFMDWAPLVQKPVSTLTPETLTHVARHGFTLVEWGGLKH